MRAPSGHTQRRRHAAAAVRGQGRAACARDVPKQVRRELRTQRALSRDKPQLLPMSGDEVDQFVPTDEVLLRLLEQDWPQQQLSQRQGASAEKQAKATAAEEQGAAV